MVVVVVVVVVVGLTKEFAISIVVIKITSPSLQYKIMFTSNNVRPQITWCSHPHQLYFLFFFLHMIFPPLY